MAPSAPCARFTIGPTGRCGRSIPPLPRIRRRSPKVSIGTSGWGPSASVRISPTTPTWCSAAVTISVAIEKVAEEPRKGNSGEETRGASLEEKLLQLYGIIEGADDAPTAQAVAAVDELAGR